MIDTPLFDLRSLYEVFEPHNSVYMHDVTGLPANVVMRTYDHKPIFIDIDNAPDIPYTIMFSDDQSSLNISRNATGHFAGFNYILFSFHNNNIEVINQQWKLSAELKATLTEFIKTNAKYFITCLESKEEIYSTERAQLIRQFDDTETISIVRSISFFAADSTLHIAQHTANTNIDTRYRIMITIPLRGNIIIDFSTAPIFRLILNEACLSELEYDNLCMFIGIHYNILSDYINSNTTFDVFATKITDYKYYIHIVSYDMNEHTDISNMIHNHNTHMTTTMYWNLVPDHVKYNLLVCDGTCYDTIPINIPPRYMVISFDSSITCVESKGLYTDVEYNDIMRFVNNNIDVLRHIVDVDDGTETFIANEITNI